MKETFKFILEQALLVTITAVPKKLAPTQTQIEDQVVEQSVWKDEMDDMLDDYD